LDIAKNWILQKIGYCKTLGIAKKLGFVGLQCAKNCVFTKNWVSQNIGYCKKLDFAKNWILQKIGYCKKLDIAKNWILQKIGFCKKLGFAKNWVSQKFGFLTATADATADANADANATAMANATATAQKNEFRQSALVPSGLQCAKNPISIFFKFVHTSSLSTRDLFMIKTFALLSRKTFYIFFCSWILYNNKITLLTPLKLLLKECFNTREGRSDALNNVDFCVTRGPFFELFFAGHYNLNGN
jgi:hypothetical protein